MFLHSKLRQAVMRLCFNVSNPTKIDQRRAASKGNRHGHEHTHMQQNTVEYFISRGCKAASFHSSSVCCLKIEHRRLRLEGNGSKLLHAPED